MSQKNNTVDPDKFANAWVIASFSILVSLLVIWLTTKNEFLAGIGAFIISLLLAIIYSLYYSFNNRKNKKIED